MKFNKIIGAFLGVAVSLGAWSCTDEVEYKPTEPTGTAEVFFSNTQNSSLSLVLDATQVEVTLNRLYADDDLTVDLTSTSYYINDNKEAVSAADVFTVPSSVTFAKGEKEVAIPIAVAFSKVLPAVDYAITIGVEGNQASLYGDVEKTFTVSYEPWTEWTVLSDPGTMQVAGLWQGQYMDYVYYRKSLVNADIEQYKIEGPVADPLFDYVFNVDKSKVINIAGDDCYFVTLESIELPLETSDGGGNFEIEDFFNFFCEANKLNPVDDYQLAINSLIQNNRNFSYLNPKTGLIVSYQTIVGTLLDPGYSYGSFMNYLQLGGYANYYIEFAKVYNIVDEFGEESLVFQANKSSDIYSYAYTITPGALDENGVAAEVEAIKADAEATLYTESQRYFTYTPEAQGDYTIVAVGYNEANEEVFHTSYVFTFTTVKADSEWESAGKAAYTDGFLYAPFAQLTEDGWNIRVGGDEWMVDIERNKNNPNIIRIVNPYNSKNWPDGYDGWDLPGNYYININMEDPNGVYIEESALGVQLSPEDGPINISSLAYDFLSEGYSIEQIKQIGVAGTLKDGVITFPGAGLLIEFQNRPGYMYTNWDFNIPVYNYNDAGERSFNLVGQIEGTGWFQLDLNGSTVTSAPKKKHSSEIKVERKSELMSPYKSRIIKKSTIDVNELVNANLKKSVKYNF